MPAAPGLRQPRAMAPGFVGGFPASSWSSLFQSYPELLLLLRPWVSEELRRFFGAGSFKVFLLTRMILDVLPAYGLDEDVLVAVLSPDLRSHTLEFVRRLFEATEKRCGDKALSLLIRKGSCAASGLERSQRDSERWAEFSWWREGSPVASTSWTARHVKRKGNVVRRSTSSGCPERGEYSSTTTITCSDRPAGRDLSREPSPSPAACWRGTPAPTAAPSSSVAAADADALPSTSAAAVQGGPACVPAPIPAQQEDAQQAPGQAVPGASAPRRGRASSRRRPCSTRKRKTGSSEDSAAPAKNRKRR